MFAFSTGQISGTLLNLSSIRVDLMNKSKGAPKVRVLIFDTSKSPKATVFDQTFTIEPYSGDFRTISPENFPDHFEVVVRSNEQNIVPNVSLFTMVPVMMIPYGDLFIWEPDPDSDPLES
ncbi:hypothetical protein ACLHDF_25505 [Priestia aryabhattai]|uniref:hypothetical protein n=1 Tax=Priestia megaterium TaxID=1404 RepID=UPI0039B9726A